MKRSPHIDQSGHYPRPVHGRRGGLGAPGRAFRFQPRASAWNGAPGTPSSRGRFYHSVDGWKVEADAWLTATEMHPEDERIRQTIFLNLELPRSASITPDETVLTVRFLAARAAALEAEGRLGAARTDLEQGLDLLDARIEDAEIGDKERQEYAQRSARLYLRLAEVWTALRSCEQALEQLDKALFVSPAPELIADRAFADEALAPLRALEGWDNLMEARVPS